MKKKKTKKVKQYPTLRGFLKKNDKIKMNGLLYLVTFVTDMGAHVKSGSQTPFVISSHFEGLIKRNKEIYFLKPKVQQLSEGVIPYESKYELRFAKKYLRLMKKNS